LWTVAWCVVVVSCLGGWQLMSWQATWWRVPIVWNQAPIAPLFDVGVAPGTRELTVAESTPVVWLDLTTRVFTIEHQRFELRGMGNFTTRIVFEQIA